MLTVTINIAGRGTGLNDAGNGQPGTSSVGHMWYQLNDGKGNSSSYGFAPDEAHHGNPFAPGDVYHNDSWNYQSTEYSRTIQITQEQYDAMKKFGDYPVENGFSKQYNGLTNSCVDFTWKALEKGGLSPTGFQGDIWPTNNIDDVKKIVNPTIPSGSTGGDPLPGLPSGGGTSGGAGGPGGGRGAAGGIGNAGGSTGASGTTLPRRDPLVFDLDGDGIETTSTRNGTVILFDHDGDGIKTGTGWVKPDDGWLVLDRNGNGTIDSGRELFGVDTLKSNGQLATDGFDALKDLDENQDGKIDAADSVFANLRIWRDLNQDGISQANELTTLADNSITETGVNSTAVRNDLGNGNMQTAAGTFTRSNGTTGTTGETNGAAANLDLLVNTFYRQFTDHIALTDQAKALPTLRGSGRVRDLDEAISLSPDLGDWVQSYTQQTTRQGQINMLDGFIEKWANTADLKSLKAQADALSDNGVRLTYNFAGLVEGTTDYDDFVRKLGVVECFMGFTYGGANGQALLTPLDAASGNITVSLAAEQIASISLAYDRFKTDIYESLVAETRLQSYSKLLLEDSQDGSKFAALENAFKQAITLNPQQGITDLIEFISSVGEARLAQIGWGSLGFLTTQLNNVPDLSTFSSELSSWTVHLAGASEHTLTGTSRSDLLVGTTDADHLYGNDGNDILQGGKGNDILDGGYGNNTYVFNRGDGQDTINSYDPTPGKLNTIQLGAGISQSDVSITRSGNFSGMDLILSIKDGNDTLTVVNFFQQNTGKSYQIEQIQFADGTIWDSQTVFAKALIGNDADNNITGYDTDDVLIGHAGNDTLDGGHGNNTYMFSRGDGQDTINSYDPTPGKLNTIQLGAGISQSDVSLTRSNDFYRKDLILSIKDSNDTITVVNFFSLNAGNSYRIEKIQFADGTNWDSQTIFAQSLIGNDGDNSMIGGDGDDTLDGGKGNDTLNGGYGNNTYLFGRGDGQDIINSYDPTPGKFNTIQLKTGVNQSDVSVMRSGNGGGTDLILSINGTSDTITVANFFREENGYRIEQIKFSDGTSWDNQVILTQILIGNDGDNVINGYEGDDTLDGGKGNDTLNGGYGNNTYLFGRGDGQDTIDSFDPTPGKLNTIQLKAGINQRDVSVMRSGNSSGINLILSIKDTNDTITIAGFFRPGFGDSYKVEQIQFADGTSWNSQAILAQSLIGNDANNTIIGYDTDDVLVGNAGNDALYGENGNDTLDGGEGNDFLMGGYGNNTYLFNRGGGQDTIYSYDPTPGKLNTIQLDAGISQSDVSLMRSTDASGIDLILSIKNSNDKITISSFFNPWAGNGYKVETIKFADGATWNIDTKLLLGDGPVLANEISDQNIKKGTLFQYVVPNTVFTETNSNNVLSYSATLANGDALPGWLKFDAISRTFSGTPANGDVGIVSIKLTATDLAGASASDVFDLNVTNTDTTNHAPVLVAPLVDRSVKQNANFNYTLPAKAFTDIDKNDKLTYSATLANGDSLPTWLKFDAATRKLSGKPANQDVGVLNIKLIATDKTGATASDTFNLTVINVNDTPTVTAPITDHRITKNTAFTYTLPINTFNDVDVGDKLTYSATLTNGKALPTWLKFNPATLTFSGTPTKIGSTKVRVTATDLAGAKVHDDFGINVVKNSTNVTPALMRASDDSGDSGSSSLQAEAATPLGLNPWDISAALLQFHLTSSDTAALGGDSLYATQTDNAGLQTTQALLAGAELNKVEQKGLFANKQAGLF